MQKHRSLYFPRGGPVDLRGGLATPAAAPGWSYLLHDAFLTPQASPLADPRIAEPGPGTWAVSQADGSWAVSAGKLLFTPQDTPAAADLSLRFSDALARADGLGMAVDLRLTTLGNPGIYCGWWNSASLDNAPRHALRSQGGLLARRAAGSSSPLAAIAADADYRLLIQPKAAGGAWYFIKGGDFGDTYKLLGHDFFDGGSELHAGLVNESAEGTFDRAVVIDNLPLPAPAVAVAGPAGGSYPVTVDAIFDLAIKAANPLHLGVVVVFYRFQDVDNNWHVTQDPAGALKFNEVNGGATVNRRSETGVWTAGATRYVTIRAAGTRHAIWYRTAKADAAATLVAGGEYDSLDPTPFDSQSLAMPTVAGLSSASDLVVYPYEWPELDHV